VNHGTRYDVDSGRRLARIVDRTGHTWAELAWDGDRLARLAVPGATVLGPIVDDPIAGRAHVIESRGTTAVGTIDWLHPEIIPTIAAPGALAAHAGGALLNVIAVLAEWGGVASLRYAGPYPTPALWRALQRSFTTTASEDAFTAELVQRAARLAREPIAIDFVPEPHDRVAHAHGFVELRETLERAVVDDITFEPGGSPARLVDHRCEIWFGDAPYAHVATFAPDGSLVDGPHPIPACTSTVIGQQFPAPLAVALGELVAEAVPAPLADDARAYLATHPIAWADLGGRVARATPDGISIHAALWDRIAPLGLGRLVLALAEALAPVVTSAIMVHLAVPLAPRGTSD
jgi:hypothetical protein